MCAIINQVGTTKKFAPTLTRHILIILSNGNVLVVSSQFVQAGPAQHSASQHRQAKADVSYRSWAPPSGNQCLEPGSIGCATSVLFDTFWPLVWPLICIIYIYKIYIYIYQLNSTDRSDSWNSSLSSSIAYVSYIHTAKVATEIAGQSLLCLSGWSERTFFEAGTQQGDHGHDGWAQINPQDLVVPVAENVSSSKHRN